MSYKKEKYIDSDGQVLDKITWDDGSIVYRNTQGETHRLNGPAYIGSNGTEFWYCNDKLHRLDGPAIVYSDGVESYFLDGKRTSKREVDLYWLKKQVEA